MEFQTFLGMLCSLDVIDSKVTYNDDPNILIFMKDDRNMIIGHIA